MKPYIASALVLCLIFTQTGCATIVSGKSQDVMIRSNPTGAHILIDGAISGTTPMVANLVRKQRHSIVISKDGYVKVTRGTTKGFNWWYIGNLLFGGAIGLIVDPISGAMFEVKPGEVNVELAADAAPLPNVVASASPESVSKAMPVPVRTAPETHARRETKSKAAEVASAESAEKAMDIAVNEERSAEKTENHQAPFPLTFRHKYPAKTAEAVGNSAIPKVDIQNIPPAQHFEEAKTSPR